MQVLEITLHLSLSHETGQTRNIADREGNFAQPAPGHGVVYLAPYYEARPGSVRDPDALSSESVTDSGCEIRGILSHQQSLPWKSHSVTVEALLQWSPSGICIPQFR